MKIDNSREAAVMSGSWSKPGAGFYNRLMKEDNYHSLINEAFLVSRDVNKDTTYASSGCKYPHHTFKDGKLVVSAPGVKAAYSRAKQMGIYKGDVKAHLDKHMRELGFLNKDGVHYEEVMEENFRFIESVIDNALGTNLVMMESELQEFDEKSHGKLKFDFRYAYNKANNKPIKIVYDLNKDIQGNMSPPDTHTDPSKWTYNQISKTGNQDHQTKGHKVLAIIEFDKDSQISDSSKGRRLQSVDAYGVFSSPNDSFHIEVGKTDNGFSYKTTHVFKKHETTQRGTLAKMIGSHEIDPLQRGVSADTQFIGYTTPGNLEAHLKAIVKNLYKRLDELKGYYIDHPNIPGIKDKITKIRDSIRPHIKNLEQLNPKEVDITRIRIISRSIRDEIAEADKSIQREIYKFTKESSEINEKYSTLAKDIIDEIKAAKSVVTESAETIEELEAWIETVVNEGWEAVEEFEESTSDDPDISKPWFIRSDDGVDNCCIKVKGYDKPMRGRSAMITLRLDDDKWEVLCKKNADDYGVPGGGWNKGETPEDAAIRELQEETLSNVKNVKRMGTLIEYHDTVKGWVKEHVPNKDDWWYGYYSAVFVGMYDGKFKGKVKAEDRESGYGWKPVDNKLMKQLPKEYQDAINDYINKGNPFKESVDVFDEKSHGELKYCYRVGFDIKTGEEICVQFEIPKGDNEFVTVVGDPDLTKNTYRDLTGVDISDHMLKKVHTTALDSVRKTFRKLGHIDFVTKPAKVVSIFTRDHKPLSSVAMVGLFSQRIMDILNKFVRDPNYGKKLIDDYRRKTGDPTSQPPSEQVFSSPLMKEYMKRELALNSDGVEEYKIGQNGGGDKHKTTKLIWDRDIFMSYKYTNALRGFMGDRPAGRGDNKKDQLDMLISGLNNKYHKTPDERNAYKNTIESTVFDEFINDASMSDGILDLCSIMESMVTIKSIHLGGFEIIANNPNNHHKLICRESYIADPLDLEKIFFESGDDFRDFLITENNEIFTEAENDPPPLENNDQQKPTSEEEQSAEEDLSNTESDANTQEDSNAAEPPAVEPTATDNDETPVGQPDDTQPAEDQPEETPSQVVPQKTPISRPKQFANQEQDKNGVRRKNLYIEFIRWAKDYNNKNIFGSNFDKDIFNGSYPFVPEEMRYFYRLADPTLCILAGGLTFFPVIQLRKLNSENKHLDQYMIFAATNDDMRVFSNVDKRVYLATEQNGEIVLTKPLANTFDTYIQTMINKGDILNGPREDTTLEYAEDLV